MTTHRRSARQLLADYGLSEATINGLLDRHAHDLAEQLREQCDCGDMGTCRCMCADRIDPEVQR